MAKSQSIAFINPRTPEDPPDPNLSDLCSSLTCSYLYILQNDSV